MNSTNKEMKGLKETLVSVSVVSRLWVNNEKRHFI